MLNKTVWYVPNCELDHRKTGLATHRKFTRQCQKRKL